MFTYTLEVYLDSNQLFFFECSKLSRSVSLRDRDGGTFFQGREGGLVSDLEWEGGLLLVSLYFFRTIGGGGAAPPCLV